MSASRPRIVFIDNSIERIHQSLDELKSQYENVYAFKNETDGMNYVISSPPDLIFMNLDLMPNDAVSLTKELHQKNLQPMPFIIVYSDKQDDFVQEMVFNSGADSFISFHKKPVVLKLFCANLLKRRIKHRQHRNPGITIDKDRYLVFNNGEPVQLPRKEFSLLELLFTNPDKFYTKAEIAANIWNDEKIAEKRIIDVHMYNIRQAFGKKIILTQKGKGYRLNKKFI